MRCEDYPCCGHTDNDPCGPEWYDRPGAFDTSIPGNEHALCDHENGDCDVDYDGEIDPDDCSHDDLNYKHDGSVECAWCYDTVGTWERPEGDPEGWPVATMW